MFTIFDLAITKLFSFLNTSKYSYAIFVVSLQKLHLAFIFWGFWHFICNYNKIKYYLADHVTPPSISKNIFFFIKKIIPPNVYQIIFSKWLTIFLCPLFSHCLYLHIIKMSSTDINLQKNKNISHHDSKRKSNEVCISNMFFIERLHV